ncbi:MAG: hypothetical protein JRG68_05805 [Deltaproteobacteria bacterium]|nr:hypothetical protein [Deltaproteobacteria bacterium]MBW2010300.1 hypothetical protein [Deltaproteobacteria bacterium]MBW2100264.1 hypothetical protein [Deltaproteobacteria bacterium]
MNIELTEEAKDIVRNALKIYLSDLRAEIVKTEKHEMKQSLHNEEDIIKDTIQKLT